MTVVLVTLAATFLIQLGLFLWKVSADGQPKIGRAPAMEVVRALATDWRWMLGFAATAAGWVLFVQATALGDISLVQPLMSSGDLVLLVLAVVFLNERLHSVEWIGVLMTILGAAALAWRAETAGMLQFNGVRLLVLVLVTAVCGVALLWINRRAHRPEVLLAPVVGLCFGVGAVLTKAMTAQFSAPGDNLISWTLLFDPYLPAVVLSNIVGLILLQAAFQRGRAAVIVPMQLAMANAVTVVAGLAVFSEQITFMRAIGIALIVCGTAALHFRSHKLD